MAGIIYKAIFIISSPFDDFPPAKYKSDPARIIALSLDLFKFKKEDKTMKEKIKQIPKAPCENCHIRSIWCKDSVHCEEYQKWAKEYRKQRSES